MGTVGALEKARSPARPNLRVQLAEGTAFFPNQREARVPAVCEMLGIPFTPVPTRSRLRGSLVPGILTRRVVASFGGLSEGDHRWPPRRASYDGDCAEFARFEEAGFAGRDRPSEPVKGSSKGFAPVRHSHRVEEFGPPVVELWRKIVQPVAARGVHAGGTM